jgi:hypothetical protein
VQQQPVVHRSKFFATLFGKEPLLMAIQIGFLLFPKITQLDLTGPFEILARVPDAQLSLLWKSLEPVASVVRARAQAIR